MILSLKTLAYNTTNRSFFSPSRNDFKWEKGIIVSWCEKKHDISNLEKVTDEIRSCTCGIYSAPNRAALLEYEKYPNSILVLLRLYGWWDLFTGPHDLPNTFVMRSWGARIIGVQMEDKTTQRYMSSVLAAQEFGVSIYPKGFIEEMIQISWLKSGLTNPYPERNPIKMLMEE